MPAPTEVDSVGSSLGQDSPAPERVLVVGASPSVTGPVTVTWDEFAEQMPNIADFSLVVLACDTFDITGGQPLANVRRVFIERGPRFLSGPDTEFVLIGMSQISQLILNDLSLGFEYAEEPGTFVTLRADEFETYLRNISHYSFILRTTDSRWAIEYLPLMLAAGPYSRRPRPLGWTKALRLF